jgi:FkbM family methyltransferase
MQVSRLFTGLRVYMKMPAWVKRQISAYYFKRIIKAKPTDHEVIWTSFLYYLMEHGGQITSESDGYRVQFVLNNRPAEVLIRPVLSSDIFVFFQVFIAGGYRPLSQFMAKHSFRPKVVIDAGANVGYFTLFALMTFSPDRVVAMEPEKTNYQQLRTNVAGNNLLAQCKLMQAALWTHRSILHIDTSEGKEWSVKVTQTPTQQACEAFSLQDLMMLENLERIDLLKIDIEGAEDILFKNKVFLDTLNQVKILAIEIHDHLTDRGMIHRELRARSFQFFEEGELTVAWNTKFIHG